MLRFRDIRDANAAGAYYGKSDGGYYLDSADLGREVGGKGADLLGISPTPDFEQFQRLLQGLDPKSGEQLTAKLIEGRLAGWDITASIPKGVTVALERGDERIHTALWDAGRETMADIERLMTTRERKGGKQEDRTTGNLVWYGFEHPETRPAREDGMPDPDRHIHFVVPNVTYDPVEQEWKAIKFRPVMDLRKYFDRRFDLRLAGKLIDLGYQVETRTRADVKGGMRYFSWDIKGVPSSVVAKFSRRTDEVEKLAEQLGIEAPVRKDKLGATSRLHKRDDLTLEDYRNYWQGRITPTEDKKIQETIKTARRGQNPRPENSVDKAVRYAIAHQFERQSVVRQADLEITAMERCLGAARPEEIEPELRNQGVLIRSSEATTKDVLAEEGRIIQFAREGRGTMRPLGLGRSDSTEERLTPAPKDAPACGSHPDHATLSADQQAVCDHIWKSSDRVILIEGDAGTGKTQTMQRTIPGIDKPGVFLAPSASASRGTLREKGFTNADTIARFLVDEGFREQARGGYLYIDEAPLAALRDIDAVFSHARDLGARVILQGDRKQHKSVGRGNLFAILDKYAGLPVGRLTRNWRQERDEYKAAVDAIARGNLTGGYDALDALGWVRHGDSHGAIVDDYLEALRTKRPGQADSDRVLVVAPTHLEGQEITGALRAELKQRGIVSKEEQAFDGLRPLGWTEAEKGDLARYDGTEILQFHRNSGPYKAGQKVRVVDWRPGDKAPDARHFQVYRREQMGLAAGDRVRITGNGHDKSGKHKLNNGSLYTVKGLTREGDLVLNNGWVVGKDFEHLAHGYVTTSHASQGRTVDRVLIPMGSASRPAINAEQFYVSVSRGRERATISSDMAADELREAIQRSDRRKSATELMGKPTPKRPDWMQNLLQKARDRFRQLREAAATATRELIPQKELAHAGHDR